MKDIETTKLPICIKPDIKAYLNQMFLHMIMQKENNIDSDLFWLFIPDLFIFLHQQYGNTDSVFNVLLCDQNIKESMENDTNIL